MISKATQGLQRPLLSWTSFYRTPLSEWHICTRVHLHLYNKNIGYRIKTWEWASVGVTVVLEPMLCVTNCTGRAKEWQPWQFSAAISCGRQRNRDAILNQESGQGLQSWFSFFWQIQRLSEEQKSENTSFCEMTAQLFSSSVPMILNLKSKEQPLPVFRVLLQLSHQPLIFSGHLKML